MLDLFVGERLFVDIRGRNMRYVQAQYDRKRNSIEVIKYGSILFSKDHTVRGILCQNEETVKVLTNFIKKEKISARNVYINISDQSVVLRIVKVPKMSDRDLKDYLDMEISQYLPVDIGTNVFDYKVLDSFEEDGKSMMNVMLTSVSKEIIQNYIDLFKKAGLNPLIIDVYPNSISRVFSDFESEDIAVVDINDNTLDFVILKSGKLFMYSNIIMKNILTCSNKEDEIIDFIVEKDEAFGAAIDEVNEFIKTYLNFFSSRHFGKTIDKIYILGRLALLRNVESYFSNLLQVEVKAGIPPKFNIDVAKSSLEYRTDLNIDKIIGMYSCNLGLALRSE